MEFSVLFAVAIVSACVPTDYEGKRHMKPDTPPRLDDLMPVMYDQLRRLAASKLATERCDHTFQPTALVHEVYLRFLNGNRQTWRNRYEFLAAAAESMRRILIDSARRRNRQKRQGSYSHVAFDDTLVSAAEKRDQLLLELEDALDSLEEVAPDKAEIVKLRYYLGLSHEEIAEALGLSRSTVIRRWNFARAWLLRRIQATSLP